MSGMRRRGGTRGRWIAIVVGLVLVAGLPAVAVAAVTSNVDAANVLTIDGDADGDGINIFCDGGGNVVIVVNGVGGPPDSGPALCADITEIIVTGGDGDDSIFLGGVAPADFSGLISPIQVDAGLGNDGVTGSPGDDVINGGGGDDNMNGGAGGTDTLDGEAGGDMSFLGVTPAATQNVTANDSGADPADIDRAHVGGSPAADTITVTNGGVTVGTQSMTFTGMEETSVFGQDGDDTLDASARTVGVNLHGDAGNDTLTGGSGNDFLEDGGSGNDTLTAGGGADFLTSRGGTDVLQGNEGDDFNSVTFTGDAANPTSTTVSDNGTAGTPCTGPFFCPGDMLEVHGTAGNDSGATQIVMTNTTVTREASAGPPIVNETVTYSDMEAQGVRAEAGNDTVTAATTTGFAFLFGGDGDDELIGGSGNNWLEGDDGIPGNDILTGGDGDDRLIGGGRTDTFQGGNGSDTFVEKFTGDALNPTGTAVTPATVADSGVGPLDVDTLEAQGTSGDDNGVAELNLTDVAVTRLTGAVTETISYGGVEVRNLSGLDGNDDLDATGVTVAVSLFGNAGNDQLFGGPGNDFLSVDDVFLACVGCPPPGPGNDNATGGLGNDTFRAGIGMDALDGQDGGDTYEIPLGSAMTINVNDTGPPGGFPNDAVLLWGTNAGDVINVTDVAMTSPTGPATVNYIGIEEPTVIGEDGDDTIDASTATVTTFLNGNDGNDQITGGDAQDFISADNFGCPVPCPAGNDTVAGGAGNDNIFSAGGTDSVDGNDGSDFITGQFGVAQNLTASDSGDPTDSDQFISQGTAGAETITVTNPQISRNPTETQTLSGFEELSVFANAGDDVITASAYPAGAFLDGGDGDDSVTGGAGPDSVNGGAGNDNLMGGAGSDFVTGDAGADIMNGGPGGDNISGGFDADEDTATYALKTLPVNLSLDFDPNDGEAGEGDNLGPGIEKLVGSSLNDTIVGGFGAETLEGGAGNDTLSGTASPFGDGQPDVLVGGPGNDTASYAQRPSTSPVNVTLDGLANDGDGFENDNVGGLLNDVENVNGGSGADTLTGNAQPNVLNGNAGNDVLNGGAGADTLRGGNGADTLNGNEQGDTLDGQAGADVFNGGPGDTDKADYGARTTAVTVTLSGGADDGAAGEGDNVGPLGDVEIVQGGSGADNITGDANVNELRGGFGNDVLNGLGNNDNLKGQQDNDTMNGNGGADQLDGGLGADTFNGGPGNDDVAFYGGRGESFVIDIDGVADDGSLGGLEGDNVGLDVEHITSGSGNDLLTGSAAPNIIDAGPGNDTLNGAGGSDRLIGGLGADTFNGGPGIADIVDYLLVGVPLTITIDGVANDGTGGGAEGDNVGLDVEQVQGGQSNDSITGSAFANTLFGGPGNDILNGLGGIDQLFGGPNDDDLFSNGDGAADNNTCGPGLDDVTMDAVGDTAAVDCENVVLV